MTAEQDYEVALADLRKAEQAVTTAESNLIKARRVKRDAERAYFIEMFPTREALLEHFK